MDKLVEEAGGWKESQHLQSDGKRPGRLFRKVQVAYWYVIPESAFDEPWPAETSI